MHKRPITRFAVACIALLVAADRGWFTAAADAQAPPLPRTAASQAVPADALRVTLLGSGSGPPVNLRQFGASILVEAGGKRLLFDCGRGATIRLTQAGIPIGSVGRVFLTHLHSDHVMQIPDLLLAGWIGPTGRKAPLEVWGPAGTRDMMSAMEKTFAFDIHVRRDVDEKLPAAGISVQSHDITEGVIKRLPASASAATKTVTK